MQHSLSWINLIISITSACCVSLVYTKLIGCVAQGDDSERNGEGRSHRQEDLQRCGENRAEDIEICVISIIYGNFMVANCVRLTIPLELAFSGQNCHESLIDSFLP